jgi:hypothetical protein
VVWECVDGHEEWVGTEVSFERAEGEDETELRFTHGKFPQATGVRCGLRQTVGRLSAQPGGILRDGDRYTRPRKIQLNSSSILLDRRSPHCLSAVW